MNSFLSKRSPTIKPWSNPLKLQKEKGLFPKFTELGWIKPSPVMAFGLGRIKLKLDNL